MKRRLSLLAALFLPLALHAQDTSAVSAALKELKAGPADAALLGRTVPLLADPAGRNSVRTAILTLDPFPSAPLVSLLANPELAVRLGALELLEEKAGGDFSFNPWLAPGDAENTAPLARWQAWAGEKNSATAKKDLLGDEQRRGYLLDLLSGDDDKGSRARRMLEVDGLASAGFLENFLSTSANLPAGSRAKIREAQYQIVLSGALGPQAATTARQLAFGSRDQMLAALATLKGCGLISMPILRDFLQHSDPLVRETAMDAMLSCGGAQSLPIVGPVLIEEKDVNVIHGALRRLKEIPGDESLKIAAAFLNHEDEDLLVSAMQACQKLCGGIIENRHFGSSNDKPLNAAAGVQAEVTKQVIAALSDTRWRVRTAALEYVTGCHSIEAKDRCLELLSDPDEFVRFSAIKASAALRADGATARLKEMMLKDPAMTGPVFEGYAALNQVPDSDMVAALKTYPPDARLAAIRAAESDRAMQPMLLQLAADSDLDVACAAVRSLGSEKERVEDSRVASALVIALRSGSPEKQAAVLDRLELPPVRGGANAAMAESFNQYAPARGEKTTLDPLYDSLLGAANHASEDKPEVVAEEPAAVLPAAQKELLNEVAKVAAGNGADSFRAAMCLAAAGDPRGLTVLKDRLPQLTTAQRSSIGEKIYEPTSQEALDLLRLLLRDPVDEIRTSAASAALSAESNPAFFTMVLEELNREGAVLKPYEIYSYHFESLSRRGAAARALKAWSSSVLENDSAPETMRVLALISMDTTLSPASAAKMLSLAKASPSQWIRRAAWRALGQSRSSVFKENAQALVSDPSAQVRVVFPVEAGNAEHSWEHRFDDVHGSRDSSWSSSSSPKKVNEEAKAMLEKLAAGDPSPEVRFESYFALLATGQPVDAQAFAALIPAQPPESKPSYRLAYWMGENVRRLGPGLAPLAAALDTSEVDGTRLEKILAATAPKGGNEVFGSFQALAAGAAEVKTAPQQTAPAEDETAQDKPARTSLKVVYFYKPGCTECERAARLLETVKKDFPLLVVEQHNFSDARGIVLHEALASRFDVPSVKRVAPALFTQGGFLVGPDIEPQALGKLLTTTLNSPQDDSWSVVEEPQIAAAAVQVEKKVNDLTLPVVLLAGLADGVNPCAFATIIFFLSYLQVARRTPREMLMVGAAFIVAVFLAYFLTGLVLNKVLEQITSRVGGVTRYLDWVFGALAILAAWLSFRDAMKAREGKLDDMTLQLPGFLKTRIRGVIRTGAKARRFVIAAFVIGIVVSFLELACTGQVYAPIIYGIQQGRGDAVMWLLAYNVAFIVPLVVIFFMAFAGVSNKKLIEFQAKHTVSVKVALGLVFIALAAMILFRDKLMHW